MVDSSIVEVVRHYLAAVRRAGINARRGIVFGSHARGEARPDSDIDLLVIAPEFDAGKEWKLVGELWGLRAETDPRIEPIPCGVRQWLEDDEIPIIEIARKEGIAIEAPEEAA